MYAGFFIRALAFFLDCLCLCVLLIAIFVAFYVANPDILNHIKAQDVTVDEIWTIITETNPAYLSVIFCILFFYFGIFPATSLHATPGQLMTRLVVVTAHDGGSIGYIRSFFRVFCMFILIPGVFVSIGVFVNNDPLLRDLIHLLLYTARQQSLITPSAKVYLFMLTCYLMINFTRIVTFICSGAGIFHFHEHEQVVLREGRFLHDILAGTLVMHDHGLTYTKESKRRKR